MSRGQIYVVDDNIDMCRSLEELLIASNYRVKSYLSALAFLRECLELESGIVLLDLRMPDCNGLDVVSQMNGTSRLPTIVITGHGQIDVAVKAIKLGAKDFVQKPFEEQELLSIIDRELRALALSHRAEDPSGASLSKLSPREYQVVMGLARGQPNKIIAHELGLSVRTVEMHRARAMSRLGCKTFADLLRVALEGSEKGSFA